MHRARDVIDGVGNAGVLRLGAVVVVGHAVVVEHHVLEHGAEPDGVPDLRLDFLREFDALGVAAALDVEDALRRPAVLVIADQRAIRIGERVVLPVPERPKNRATFFGSSL
jgi:hypothetical protein